MGECWIIPRAGSKISYHLCYPFITIDHYWLCYDRWYSFFLIFLVCPYFLLPTYSANPRTDHSQSLPPYPTESEFISFLCVHLLIIYYCSIFYLLQVCVILYQYEQCRYRRTRLRYFLFTSFCVFADDYTFTRVVLSGEKENIGLH